MPEENDYVAESLLRMNSAVNAEGGQKVANGPEADFRKTLEDQVKRLSDVVAAHATVLESLQKKLADIKAERQIPDQVILFLSHQANLDKIRKSARDIPEQQPQLYLAEVKLSEPRADAVRFLELNLNVPDNLIKEMKLAASYEQSSLRVAAITEYEGRISSFETFLKEMEKYDSGQQ